MRNCRTVFGTCNLRNQLRLLFCFYFSIKCIHLKLQRYTMLINLIKNIFDFNSCETLKTTIIDS